MREYSRNKAHREHMVRNLATSLILFEKIDTTEAKAKEVKSVVDKLIARSKDGALNDIRALNTVLFDQNAVQKLIKELLPRYKDRKSGFIRSYHLKNRIGDNSRMMRLELVDRKVFVAETQDKNSKTATKDKADQDGQK